MRVHYVTDICATANKDVYSTSDDGFKSLDLPPPSTSTSNQYQSPILKPLAALKPIRPAYKIITNNGPLRGIKTKIVQKRNDFLASNGGSDSFHTGIVEKNHQYTDWLPATSDSDQFNLDESSISSNHSNNYTEVNDYTITSPLSIVKKEPTDSITDDIVANSQWNCFICKEYFGSSKEYEMHAMFVHNIN